jgi:hypothetical protein
MITIRFFLLNVILKRKGGFEMKRRENEKENFKKGISFRLGLVIWKLHFKSILFCVDQNPDPDRALNK